MNNTKKKPEFHGSDLEKIEEYYHIPKEEIVSFGANVNPLGLSPAVKEKLAANLDIISTYPDRNYKSLKNAIGAYSDVSPEHIVVGNGSTELISLLISQRNAKKASIIMWLFLMLRRNWFGLFLPWLNPAKHIEAEWFQA